MAEYGSNEFKQLWRAKGFFVALSAITGGKATPEQMRSMNARLIDDRLAESRKEVAKISAALERIKLNIQPALQGGKADEVLLEQNIIALGGWIASILESYDTVSFYLSEAGYQKVSGFFKEDWDQTHPSHTV